MRKEPRILGAVKESNTLKTEKQKIKIQRENYSNVQFDINSNYNFLFLRLYKLQYLKYLSKEKIIEKLLKIREGAEINEKDNK